LPDRGPAGSGALPIFVVDGLRLIERLTLMLRAKPA
jgi:hypothetical protein